MTQSSADVAPPAEPDKQRARLSHPDRREERLFAVLTAVVPTLCLAVVYAGVRNHETVWDDGLLSFARVYQTCDLETIFTSAANTFEYLPVRDLTLCADHALWGNWAGGFHLQNVFLFMIACGLLGFLYRRLFRAAPDAVVSQNAALLALLCVLVFALHPLQVEPVAFITARNALLALVFSSATLVAIERWVATSNRGWYALSVVFTVLALFSKATALPVALLVFLVHFHLARDRAWTGSAIVCLPHLAVGVASGVLHAVVANTHGAMGQAPSIGEFVARVPRAGFIPQFYLYKFVWPFNQSTDYVLDGVRENAVGFGLGAVLLAGIFGLILLRGWPRRSAPALFAAGYLVALLPILNLFPTHPPVADRYAQLPLVFLVPLIIVPVVTRLPRRAAIALMTVLIALLATLSQRQVAVWKNDESVFAHAVAVNPNAVQSIENLAYTQWLRNKPEAALESFRLFSEQRPNDGQYELFQAWYAVREGELERAKGLLERARRKAVAGYLVHIVQAEIYTAERSKRRAAREYERARDDAQRRFQRDSRARIYLPVIRQRLRELGTR